MLGGADNPNGELLSYIIGADSTAVLKRIPVVKCRIFPVCWPCLQNAVRTVLVRMSG